MVFSQVSEQGHNALKINVSEEHKDVYKRMFLENAKGTIHNPNLAFCFPSVPLHSWGYFVHLTLEMSVLWEFIQVSMVVLHSLLVSFGDFLRILSICYFGIFSKVSWARVHLFRTHTSPPWVFFFFNSFPRIYLFI